MGGIIGYSGNELFSESTPQAQLEAEYDRGHTQGIADQKAEQAKTKPSDTGMPYCPELEKFNPSQDGAEDKLLNLTYVWFGELGQTDMFEEPADSGKYVKKFYFDFGKDMGRLEDMYESLHRHCGFKKPSDKEIGDAGELYKQMGFADTQYVTVDLGDPQIGKTVLGLKLE